VFDVRLDAQRLVVHDDGAPGGEEALRVAVAVGRGHVPEDVLQDLRRALEAEGGRVAGVQLEDAVTCRLQPHRLLKNRPSDLVTDIGELCGLDHLHVWELTARLPGLGRVLRHVGVKGARLKLTPCSRRGGC